MAEIPPTYLPLSPCISPEQAEAAKREQWMAEKTKEIKDSTVRGLEIQSREMQGRCRGDMGIAAKTKEIEERNTYSISLHLSPYMYLP